MLGDITRTTKTWRDRHLVSHEINGVSQQVIDEPAPRQGVLFPKSARSKPVPFDQWPIWAKALKHLATPNDKGIGDVIARTIGAENSEAFKKWFKATTGKDCGCTGRQRRWNIEYPL